ncbi:FxSxx-COOH system tetratricopeptide repeat protein, partial [Actinomadura rubrisoli]
GGVGKSTLAARYAAARAGERRQKSPVWWITADSAAGVRAGLADLAAALQPGLSAVLPLEALAELATAWLSAHEGWLLVLDNVTDPADVAPLLGRTMSGQIVVTSRLGEGWHRYGARPLRLDVLTERQSVELLLRIAAHLDPVTGGAAELCGTLGFLPLAIEQAAAYLHQTRLAPAAYLDLLAARPGAMYDQAARGADAAPTVARTWQITLDRIADVPLAGHILRILAWWAPEAIPRTLLGPLASPAEIVDALGVLAAYDMIALDTRTIAVHRLVQAVTRTPDPADPHRRAADIDSARDRAADLLNQARPATTDDPEQWPAWRALLPHVDALTVHARGDTDTADTDLLLYDTGVFLHGQGALDRALRYLERSLAASERLHGSDHPDTMAGRLVLASAYEDAGDLGRALPVYEQTLTDMTRVLGPDHPDTLSCRDYLAGAYTSVGDPARAIAHCERTLADCARVLGPGHSQTLTSRHNLAQAYRSAGDLARAIPLFDQNLADRRRFLGADHVQTLASLNSLARAHRDAGDLARGLTLSEQAQAECARVLGPDHPLTLTSRSNLAYAYRDAGRAKQAADLLKRTLSDMTRVLGDGHPDTLDCGNGLACLYEAVGDRRRAIALFERTLTECVRVLGPDHHHTLSTRNNLAHAYHSAGDLARAIPLFRHSLRECRRVLGEDHPLTKAARGNLAAAQRTGRRW